MPQANPREERGTRYIEKVDFIREEEEERLGMKAWVIENLKQERSKKREKRGDNHSMHEPNKQHYLCLTSSYS